MVDQTPEENVKNTKPQSEDLPRIRTYAADLSEEIRERGATLSSIISSEKAAQKPVGEPPQPEARGRTLLMAGLAFLFIMIGIASVLAAILMRDRSATPTAAASIIFANTSATIDAAAGPVEAALAAHRADDPLSLGEVEELIITESGTPLPPMDLARALGAPDALAREVTEVMVGIHAFDHTQPFIIFRVTAYDRAFNAMLRWEPDMARSLGAFFAPIEAPPSVSAPTVIFSDAVIKNLDVRQTAVSWPLMYTFPSQHLLIMTTNEFTLREVVSRLGTAQ